MWLVWVACTSGPAPVEVPQDAPFVRARVEEGGLCDGPLCGGYRELWGEGTLRWRDGAQGREEERSLTATELDAAALVISDEALWTVLRDGCEPAGVLVDSTQTLTVETWEEQLSNTRPCDDAALLAVWSLLETLVTGAE